MTEGFFRISYTGYHGSGLGILVLRDGIVSGADVSGGVYNGIYSEEPETGKITVSVHLVVPAGVSLVQTGVSLASPADIPIAASFEQGELSGGKPVLIRTPIGPVNVILNKIRDFSA
jgi:hypothetical protein